MTDMTVSNATQTAEGAVRIDFDAMPGRDFDNFARETVEACRRFFALPGVQEKYEAWLAKRKGKEQGK